MKRIIKILIFYCFLILMTCKKGQAAEVLIIGGGPTGLATAIEANQKGERVTIIEKRESYIRPQFVFLLESTLELLENWGVKVPHLQVLALGEEKMGFVRIKHLEEGLNTRVKELGIKKIQAKFDALEKVKKQAIVTIGGESYPIAYDYIVAADGVHSKVRASVGIECECLGRAVGVWTFIPFKDNSREIDVSPILRKENYFIRRISVPMGSLIFLQSLSNDTQLFAQISMDSLKARIAECEWTLEMEKLEAKDVIAVANVPIILQRAKMFSSSEKSALILGDAAASASFFHGMGVNTSLQTAVLAGEFFRNRDEPDVYTHFNQKMEDTINQFIQFSRFLFEEELIEDE